METQGQRASVIHRLNPPHPYLLHAGVAARQLLPEVGDVMVVLLQVLLEVVASERQQGLLHVRVELQENKRAAVRDV